MKERYLNLDALRGYAIFTMILSGSIAYGPSMPAWMFHAQVPPPNHQFNPNLPGITWVDLVFPFFIFCMGAAIPIALKKHAIANNNKQVIFTAFRRFFLLTFFALFLEHFKSNRMLATPSNGTYWLSLAGYLLLFFAFSKLGAFFSKKIETIINSTALAIGIAGLIFLPLNNGEGFKITNSDIIIIVLANMALFGTLAWWFTRNNIVLRLGILPFVMAIFLGAKTPDSWNEFIYLLTPSTAIYKFYFLKYLFILIPGTIAGDWLLKYKDTNPFEVKTNSHFKILGLIFSIMIISNLFFLFTRQLAANLLLTIFLLSIAKWQIKKIILSNKALIEQFFYAGAFALLLGLTFEAYEGGIKKDFSTYSYYFVTVGLAFFSFIVLAVFQSLSWAKSVHRFMVLSGQNPMMAYISGSLFLLPIMHLTGIIHHWNEMNDSFFAGFLKGLIFTLVACGITIPFTKKGMVWKS
jgi:predicted acyltransferase